MKELSVSEAIHEKIYTIRNTQVMLDVDLAELYGVEVKRLNEQVKRNIERFPENFRIQLTNDELKVLRSQFATLEKAERGRHRKHSPPIKLHKFTKAHDRFLIIDGVNLYHLGASLKDLGKKWFAFTKLEIDTNVILEKLKPEKELR